jgi:hypothetical protein
MNKQMPRFTAPLQGDNWKNELRAFLRGVDLDPADKLGEEQSATTAPKAAPVVARAPEVRFALPDNVLSALDALNPVQLSARG